MGIEKRDEFFIVAQPSKNPADQRAVLMRVGKFAAQRLRNIRRDRCGSSQFGFPFARRCLCERPGAFLLGPPRLDLRSCDTTFCSTVAVLTLEDKPSCLITDFQGFVRMRQPNVFFAQEHRPLSTQKFKTRVDPPLRLTLTGKSLGFWGKLLEQLSLGLCIFRIEN
ncbi:hypothetical protein RSOE_22875 [Ralstonia solanacearum OE1-1]|nr:hypothetical protein RSOE_22875 [Ralstonia solanacearum OE1-1]